MLISNLFALVILALFAAVVYYIRENRLWREAFQSLWQRRPIAVTIVGLYFLIGILDSISWVGGIDASKTQDLVAASKPRSIIDRVFSPETRAERSYSAPFASKEFYGEADLNHPGTHWLGTDKLGRDVLYLVFKGVKVALLVGGLTSLIVIPLALFFGVSAGYFGGRLDDAVFFVMSTLASIPGILLLIALITALGKGTVQVCIALGVTGWVSFSRLARAETLKLREADYVQAARGLGVSDFTIIMRHILPNLSHLMVITFALLFTALVLSETILAYLGIGVDGSWGQMIDQARDELSRDPIIWWNLFGASLGLFILVLSVNLVGDAVRDILDPRTLRERE